METTSSDRVEVIGSDDDAEDVSCSTRAAPGAASPSDTDSDERLAGVEMVDLVNDLETAAGSGLGGNKRDRDDSAERSASPSTSSRSVRLKPDAAVAREPKGVESASDSEDRRGSPSRGDSDSAARSAPVAKPLTPDRLGGPVDDDGVCLNASAPAPAPAPTTSDATAVNTAAAIETVLEGLARDEKLAEEDEEQFQKIPETMLAMPLLRHQRRAVSWMRRREAAGSSPRGGMLADDQGLGKTFSAIALIAANPPPPRRRAAATPEARRGNDGARLEGSEKPAGGTLVVCPHVRAQAVAARAGEQGEQVREHARARAPRRRAREARRRARRVRRRADDVRGGRPGGGIAADGARGRAERPDVGRARGRTRGAL
jgi:hypothetical protein